MRMLLACQGNFRDLMANFLSCDLLVPLVDDGQEAAVI